MWIEAILLGIVISFFKNGRLTNFSKLEFRFVYLLLIGLGLQLLPFFMNKNEFVLKNSKEIIFFGSVLIFAFYVLNLAKRGFIVIAIGSMMNLLALLTNSMRMPLLVGQNSIKYLLELKEGILSGDIVNYILFENANFITKFLGKTISMPSFYPFTKVFGIGDFVIAIGVVIFIVRQLTIHHRHSFRNNYTRRTRF